MKKIRQAIINWLFQDDIPRPAQQQPLPCQLPFEPTTLFTERSFPILDLHRMEMTTFYFKGPATHPQDSEPTKKHSLRPNEK